MFHDRPTLLQLRIVLLSAPRLLELLIEPHLDVVSYGRRRLESEIIRVELLEPGVELRKAQIAFGRASVAAIVTPLMA
jgi:hypothetical protein